MRGIKMKKLYSRIVFGPDDTSIPGGIPEDAESIEKVDGEVTTPVEDQEEVSDLTLEMEDLFEDTAEDKVDVDEVDPEPEPEPEVTPEPEPEVTPEVEPEPEVKVEVNPEIEELKSTIAKLQETINTLAQPTSVADPVQIEPVKPVEIPGGVNLTEMFKDADLTEVMETKEGFLGFMQQIADSVRSSAIADTLQEFDRQAPVIMQDTIQKQKTMEDIRSEFFSANPALEPVSQYVASVANELSGKNPEWTVDKVLQEAAKETKTRLNIPDVVEPKPEKDTKKEESNKPALPGATGGARQKPAPANSLADEMEDLFSDFN